MPPKRKGKEPARPQSKYAIDDDDDDDYCRPPSKSQMESQRRQQDRRAHLSDIEEEISTRGRKQKVFNLKGEEPHVPIRKSQLRAAPTSKKSSSAAKKTTGRMPMIKEPSAKQIPSADATRYHPEFLSQKPPKDFIMTQEESQGREVGVSKNGYETRGKKPAESQLPAISEDSEIGDEEEERIGEQADDSNDEDYIVPDSPKIVAEKPATPVTTEAPIRSGTSSSAMETSTIHRQHSGYPGNALHKDVISQQHKNVGRQLQSRNNGNSSVIHPSPPPHSGSQYCASASQNNWKPSSQGLLETVGDSNRLQLPLVQATNKRSRVETASDADEGVDDTDSEDEDKAANIAERRATGKRGRKRAAPSVHARTVRLEKYGPAGPLVYESLQASVCAELVRTRKVSPGRQVELINEVLSPVGLHTNSRVMSEAIESVRDWIGNKSCRLRKYFVAQGEDYQRNHPNEDYGSARVFPDVRLLQQLVGDENIREWLHPVRSRVDIFQCLASPELRNGLMKVYVFGFRYGIKAAYSDTFAAAYFQQSIEGLDKYTANFNIPIRPFSASARAERRKKEQNMREIDPDFDALDDIYGDMRFVTADDGDTMLSVLRQQAVEDNRPRDDVIRRH